MSTRKRNVAATKIQRFFRKKKFLNDRCPISFKCKKEIKKKFVVVTNNGLRIFYDPVFLAKWVGKQQVPSDPYIKRNYDSVELKRLSKIAKGYEEECFRRFQKSWRYLFLEATSEKIRLSFNTMARIMNEEKSDLYSVLLIVDNEKINDFLISFTYVFCIDKIIYKRLKREFKNTCKNSEFCNTTLEILDNIVNNMFSDFVIDYLFCKQVCIPRLRKLKKPKKLI